jgi:hypothetical protein
MEELLVFWHGPPGKGDSESSSVSFYKQQRPEEWLYLRLDAVLFDAKMILSVINHMGAFAKQPSCGDSILY